jgi:hypothetical protein
VTVRAALARPGRDARGQPTETSPQTPASKGPGLGALEFDRSGPWPVFLINRARYDAELTVAAFAARLKDAVDLDSVREDLAGVVQKALEPAHISVWMNERG